jgi:hypothetical protein
VSGPVDAREVRLDRAPLVSELVGLANGTWDMRFRNDVEEGAAFIVGRALALVTDRIDCVLSFERFPLSDISIVNPLRVSVTPTGGYPILRERLESDPGYDAVPLSIGRARGGASVWDGHRRLETYRAAGRSDVPAWVATFRKGSGLFVVSAPAGVVGLMPRDQQVPLP